jgi:hypothetical protein
MGRRFVRKLAGLFLTDVPVLVVVLLASGLAWATTRLTAFASIAWARPLVPLLLLASVAGTFCISLYRDARPNTPGQKTLGR